MQSHVPSYDSTRTPSFLPTGSPKLTSPFHQPLTTIGRKLCTLLHPSPTSPTGNALLVLSVGLASGLLHTLGDYMFFRRLTSGALIFFLSQSLGMLFEQLIFGIGNRKEAPQLWVKLVGYAWTAAFLTATGGWWLRPVLNAGLLEDRAPLRVCEGLLYGKWIQL